MNYLRGALFGAGGAVIAVVLWVLVAFLLPVVLPLLMSRITNQGGASGARITSGSVLIAALIGFVIGVVWGVRR